jgi:hypothetical protein
MTRTDSREGVAAVKNQTITPMAALRSRAAASILLPTTEWFAQPATAGHVSAGAIGVGTQAGMPVNLVSVTKTDPDLRPTAVGTAKQARPPRGIPR